MPKPVCVIRESRMPGTKNMEKDCPRKTLPRLWIWVQPAGNYKGKNNRLFPSITLYSFGLYERVRAVGNGWVGWDDNL